jgi:hypothetical protein
LLVDGIMCGVMNVPMALPCFRRNEQLERLMKK